MAGLGHSARRGPLNEFFDWLNGKWPDGFAPLGPYLLTSDEVPDPQSLKISLHLNGERKQHSSTREMISTVAETIAFASRFMTLEPGDARPGTGVDCE